MEYPKPVKSAQRILYFAENSSNPTCFSCRKIANFPNKIKKFIEYVFTRAKKHAVTELTKRFVIFTTAAVDAALFLSYTLRFQGLHAVPVFLHFYTTAKSRRPRYRAFPQPEQLLCLCSNPLQLINPSAHPRRPQQNASAALRCLCFFLAADLPG